MLKRLLAAGAAFGAFAFAAASVSAQTPSTLEAVKKRDQVIWDRSCAVATTCGWPSCAGRSWR